MDLQDVYNAFEYSRKNDVKNPRKLKSYVFGTFVTNKQILCYKILNGGKLTVYLTLIDKITGNDIIYESNLTLAKQGVISLSEIKS